MAKIRNKDKAKMTKQVAAIIRSWQMACEDNPKIDPECLAQVIVGYFAAVVRVKQDRP